MTILDDLTDARAPSECVVHTRAYRDGVLVASGFPVRDVPRRMAEPGALVWVGLPISAAEPVLRGLAPVLQLDDLSIEDALCRHERPKVNHYPEYVLLNAYLTALDSTSGRLRTFETSAIAAANVLLTVHEGPTRLLDDLQDRWDDRLGLCRHGTVALLYGLIDQIVDSHFDTVQALDRDIDALEDLLFNDHSQHELQARTFRLRKSLAELRRVVLPMRDVVATLLRRDAAIQTGDMMLYFEDVHDHVLRVIEWTESLRDMVTAVFESNLTLQDHRLNVVIKKLTSWAAIIAVPTLITGFFGQNVSFPGEGRWSGLGLSAGIILVSSIALFRVFRRRDWV